MSHTIDDFFEEIITVKLPGDRSCVDIIDQTLLPGEIRRIRLTTREELHEAIRKLRVRGAPAIGVCAAYGLAVCANRIQYESYEDFFCAFREIKEYLATARPTAVNLFWALDRMERCVSLHAEEPVAVLKDLLFAEALQIREEDVKISRAIGETGYGLIKNLKKEGSPVGIMTHCNAGTLATAKYGTATAPMYMALEHGFPAEDMHVYCDETRPLLQGARLTSFELHHAGIPVTVQCDNMASSLMQTGKIDIIFTGCDRVAENGDAANKIGTSSLAIIARHYGIPFYICAPSSTIDVKTPTGKEIPIEMRDEDEITSMWYRERMVEEGIDAYNPAFDVTHHSLITGIITEKGLFHAPFHFAEIFG